MREIKKLIINVNEEEKGVSVNVDRGFTDPEMVTILNLLLEYYKKQIESKMRVIDKFNWE